MSAKRGNATIEKLDNENILQAVIIMDTFSQHLSPFCDYMPSSFIPLANRPMLDYTLECLYSARVQEVILFCPSYAEEIRKFVSCRQDKWPGLAINIVALEGCRTLGDVMRDLDTKALIRSDFILLSGSVVGNLQLLPALENHLKTQKVDKGAVMTLIFKECGRKWKAIEDDFIAAIDVDTNRLLVYSKELSSPGKVHIPMELVLATDVMDLRSDLIDTQVSICSMAVPPMFSDNFDFQTLDDFMRGVLVQDELLTSTIYAYYLPNGEYAATVNSWANYQQVTHDVINRWVYPMVPDRFADEPYVFKRNHIYTQKNVTLSQGSKLEMEVVIASGSTVGQNTTVEKSVIGKNCQIGSDVVIEGAYIMDNVVVKDGCRITHSVIGPNCTLHTQAKVTEGSILGDGVVIDEGKSISGLKVQAHPPKDSDQGEAISSKAYLYKSASANDSDSETDTNVVVTGLRVNMRAEKEEWVCLSDSDDDDDVVIERSLSPALEDTNLFYNEVVDSLVRGYEDKLPCDNLMLEINSSRYAYNVSMSEVTVNVVRALLTLPKPDNRTLQHLVSHLRYFTPILQNYIRTESAQRDCLLGIQDVAGNHSEIFDVLVKIVHWLYDKDILSEEVLILWHSDSSAEAQTDVAIKVRKQLDPIIKWLKVAEEKSSTDDDDNYDDDDDDDGDNDDDDDDGDNEDDDDGDNEDDDDN